MLAGIFAAAAVLVVAGWLEYRRRLKRVTERGLSDGDIRRIEASGTLDSDEPLDLEEAAEEEERFWEESWDEPEPL
ncbi:MAG: hypothetical protein ACOC3J_06695 [Gemmatimonadota bacterium]